MNINESIMNSASLVGDLSEKTIKSITNVVTTVASQTTYSLKEVADMYYFHLSAGKTANQAKRALMRLI